LILQAWEESEKKARMCCRGSQRRHGFSELLRRCNRARAAPNGSQRVAIAGDLRSSHSIASRARLPSRRRTAGPGIPQLGIRLHGQGPDPLGLPPYKKRNIAARVGFDKASGGIAQLPDSRPMNATARHPLAANANWFPLNAHPGSSGFHIGGPCRLPACRLFDADTRGPAADYHPQGQLAMWPWGVGAWQTPASRSGPAGAPRAERGAAGGPPCRAAAAHGPSRRGLTPLMWGRPRWLAGAGRHS